MNNTMLMVSGGALKESFPTNLYGFNGMDVASAVRGVCRFGLACLHDPFAWSYSDTETSYKNYLQQELFKRQIEYVEILKKKSDDLISSSSRDDLSKLLALDSYGI